MCKKEGKDPVVLRPAILVERLPGASHRAGVLAYAAIMQRGRVEVDREVQSVVVFSQERPQGGL